MKTVLALSGSLRRDSVNTLLLRIAQEQAPDGVDVVLYSGLADVPAFNEDDEAAPGPAVIALREAISSADGLLLSTPEYNFGVPGALKNALDWASRPYGDSVLTGRRAAVMGVSPSPFAARQARTDLRRSLALAGAVVDDETTGFVAGRLDTDRLGVERDVRDALAQLLSLQLAAIE